MNAVVTYGEHLFGPVWPAIWILVKIVVIVLMV